MKISWQSKLALLTLVIFLGILLFLPYVTSPYIVTLAILVFMNVVLASSWNLFSGFTGYISLGQGLFFGLGAYSFSVMVAKLGLPIGLAFIMVFLTASLFSFLIGIVLLKTRIRVAYFAVMLLGLNEIIKTIIVNNKWLGSSYGLTVPPITNTLITYYYLLGMALLIVFLAKHIEKSRLGLGLKAIVADETAAESAGIYTVRLKMSVFIISGIFMALTGAMLAWFWSYIDPYMAFDLIISFDMVIMAVFGGIGTVLGPVLGATSMTLIKEILSNTIPQFYTIAFGLIVILMIIFFPGGLMEIASKILPQRGPAKARGQLKKKEGRIWIR